MQPYHKIQTIFKRDPTTKYKTLLEGDWSRPEFEYLALNQWIFTEKVDGTNIRVGYSKNKITFGGKTDRAQIPATLVGYLNDCFLPQKERFDKLFGNATVCLYGEGYGAKIQKGGGNYRPDQSFVLFDVQIDNWWLQRSDIEDIASKLGITVVPIKGKGTLFQMIDQAKNGIISNWGNFQAEGYVARPAVELQTRSGSRIITKIKCLDFTNFITNDSKFIGEQHE